MFDPDQYELIDFGENENGLGEKLECFGGSLVVRPSPAATGFRRELKKIWSETGIRFDCSTSSPGEKGVWVPPDRFPEPWEVQHKDISLQIRPTPFGHLGIFPEQQSNWDWIAEKISRAGRPLRILNLFAYTGGTTLIAAAAGAEVVHIDSAKNVVQWARENAMISGMKDHPIRWIVEDCQLFCERERRRGNRYDGIILDPPSFGHGPKGEVWKVEKDLIRLLRNCRAILSEKAEFMVLTCHSPGYGPAELQATFCDAVLGSCSTRVMAEPLCIYSKKGRALNAGNVVRWSR